MVLTVTLYICSQCGAPTEWDETLGPKPLCAKCWDKAADNWSPGAAYRRKYYQAHREEQAAYRRKYYQAHREEHQGGVE